MSLYYSYNLDMLNALDYLWLIIEKEYFVPNTTTLWIEKKDESSSFDCDNEELKEDKLDNNSELGVLPKIPLPIKVNK